MIARPQSAEAAPYYFRYIDRVSSNDVLAVLESQLPESLAFFRGISEERSLHRYAPDKWSIRQVLNHVTDSERVFAFRALWFARGFETALPSFEQEIAAASAQAEETSWAVHMEDFTRVRHATLSLFQNLPPAAWARSGIASDNRVTVRALAFIIAGHLEHHLAMLRERYL
ncbi:MAG: DinB family protein [Acidobacteriales bacterium]|nr:DinB family protein [Terriglobales bacterium]